jgi:hypothetical protein
MVAMRGAQALGPIRILNQEEIRAVVADGGRDGQPGLPRILDLAIREAEKLHRVDAEDPRRLALFLLADRRQALGRHGSVARPLLSIRRDAVGDPGAGSCEVGHSCVRFGVVWMRDDDKGTYWGHRPDDTSRPAFARRG